MTDIHKHKKQNAKLFRYNNNKLKRIRCTDVKKFVNS